MKAGNKMKISVCVDALYMGQGLQEAIDDVMKNGLDTIEFWGWEDKDIKALAKYKREKGFHIAAMCTKFISLTDASSRGGYIEGLKESLEVAKSLECKCLISQTGADLPISRKEQHESLVEGLKACVPYLEEYGVTLVIEPLNIRVDHAGYFLSGSDEAAEVITEVGSPHVKMLYDIYHQQITEGDLIRRIRKYHNFIGHYHAAGNPGRHELYDSEIDYKRIFHEIKETGYQGYVGMEYFPQDEPAKGLDYVKKVIK